MRSKKHLFKLERRDMKANKCMHFSRTHFMASAWPHSSEQYFEPGREWLVHWGPQHCWASRYKSDRSEWDLNDPELDWRCLVFDGRPLGLFSPLLSAFFSARSAFFRALSASFNALCASRSALSFLRCRHNIRITKRTENCQLEKTTEVKEKIKAYWN